MKKSYSFAQKALTMALLAMPLSAFAQNLSEGWYQITRNMSARDLKETLATTDNILGVLSNITRNDYLYVTDEIVKEENGLLGKSQKVYGAQYKEGLANQISTGDVNTYFYVTPVEGKEEAYTIRSYNGHYLHSDGTFSVSPETLYLGPALDFKLMNTYEKKNDWDFITPGLIDAALWATNGIMKVVNNFSGYSVGKAPKTFELNTSKKDGGIFDLGNILALANLKLPIGFSVSYQEQSWQQNITEVKNTETDPDTGESITTTEYKRGEYLDAHELDLLKLDWSAISGADLTNYTTLPIVLINFVLNNFVSDSYRFNKIDLNSVAAGGDGYLGSIIGAINRQQLVPYTIKIEGWDGTFTVNKPSDYKGLDRSKQLTHTNASVIINSSASHGEFESAPLYDGATIFAVKNNSFFNKKNGSFVDEGTEHECSNVVIPPHDYKGGFLGFGATAIQDFSKCISAACVDEENHIIHVYLTEPDKTWKVSCEEGKYVTRNAPFALELATLSGLGSVGGFFEGTSDNVEVTYPVAINDQELQFETISGVIPAHTPVIMKNTHKQSWTDWKQTHHMYFKVVDSDDAAPEGNMLHGVCFAHELDADVNAYVLKTRDGQQKFYKLNQEDRMLAPWRAYLEYDGLTAESGLRIAGFEEVVTGANTVLAPESDNTIYDLSGRRVSTSNGVTIVGGKKVIK